MRAYLGAMRHYATFSGRTSRAGFWQAHTVLLPLILIAFGGVGLPFAGGSRSVWPALLFVLIVLPHAVPWSALVVRRLHDMGFRGWWALIALVPLVLVVPLGIVALLAWACRRGTPVPNRFGPATADTVDPSDMITVPPLHAPATPSRDPVAEIERLAQLKDSGALTEAEFAALKARALGQGEVPQ